MTDIKAHLTVESKDPIELPVYSGSLSSGVVDIQTLVANNPFSYAPGFAAPAACESNITFIYGKKGVLLHRGYPIELLAEKPNHLETRYLLLYGELPTKKDKAKFTHTIKYHTIVYEQMITFFNGFRRNAHPMAIICGAVGALSAFYHNSLNIEDNRHREITAFRLIAKMSTLAAMSYKFSTGQPFVYPDNNLDYSANFLHMMFGTSGEDSAVDSVFARAMDRIFLLHADHEQNASTSAVRLMGCQSLRRYRLIYCRTLGSSPRWGQRSSS